MMYQSVNVQSFCHAVRILIGKPVHYHTVTLI